MSRAELRWRWNNVLRHELHALLADTLTASRDALGTRVIWLGAHIATPAYRRRFTRTLAHVHTCTCAT